MVKKRAKMSVTGPVDSVSESCTVTHTNSPSHSHTLTPNGVDVEILSNSFSLLISGIELFHNDTGLITV